MTISATATPPSLDRQMARSLALEAGFTEASLLALPAEDVESTDARFRDFIYTGYHGQMQYLARRNEHGHLVRGRVDRPFPWAQSVLLCMASYHGDAPHSIDPAPQDRGWIARYAWTARRDSDSGLRPSDYHKILLKRLRQVESTLKQHYGDFESRAFVDTGPLLERAAARAAGLGWVGKNTCLIHPTHGSWTFLAALVMELPASVESPLVIPDRCGSCTRCLDACPTGALIAPYQMDATRCIAYLTIEHRDAIDPALSDGMGRQVFGCDICQDVCPWNRKAPIARDEALQCREELVNPSLEWLAAMDESRFETLFNGSPIRRTGFWSMRRNVAIAMGNSGLAQFIPWLEHQADSPSATAAFRHAAQWALRRLRSRNKPA